MNRVFLFDPGDEVVANLPRLSAALLSTLESDELDEDAYNAALREIGDAGLIDLVWITWAQLLAHTHTPDEDLLAPHLSDIPEHQWRGPVDRHGQNLIATARNAVADPREEEALLALTEQAIGELDNDGSYWLTWVMAVAVRPVVDDVGGINAFATIAQHVAGAAHELTPDPALGPATAGLSAIAAGHLDSARVYLSSCHPRAAMGALLPVAVTQLHGHATTVLSLDEHGIPDGAGDPAGTEGPAALLRELLDALLAPDRDRNRVAAATDAVATASDDDQILVSWYLALTVGYQLAQQLTRRT
ncbi:hypothetical protein [Amycolatopsis saalfeldensis]|uniref:Uncharacterized protein n=1 Tax=Amycolatopsis saalfeldensis TaxID=394193 RepID=A0A1H8YNL2_9PSEU|nr:hypothetical protein [Amycolatopsis saalfeldensis]SEP53746.1 hypothetical protein SAMN04489732_13048 [Amycolatopsis saalfeldensis]